MSRISVALCTYQGAEFLNKQLESILQQSTAVDEIFIFDDGSTDGTMAILKEFKSHVKIDVSIHVNDKNIGSSKNFEQCIQACTGDIIFLCDQDDVWKPNKVARLVGYLSENPTKDAVFSNAKMINQAGESTGITSFQKIEFTPNVQHFWNKGGAFEILLKGYVVTGATLAIRKSILSSVFPVPAIIPELIHDGWIALNLAIENKIGFTTETLIEYREHANQQVGLNGKTPPITLKDRLTRSRNEKLNRINKKYQDALALHDYFNLLPNIHPKILNEFISRMLHYKMRSHLPENRIGRIISILKAVIKGNYERQDGGKWWRTVLGDLLE